MHKSKIWLIFALVSLASCQTSRFMQDDMYFSQIDAIREVREHENAIAQAKAKANKNQTEEVADEEVIPNEDYYDYSYTSRLRRFNSKDNTWSYYDPYYTNYYWYNNSNPGYFGNSVYSTYHWWGSEPTTTKGWINPFKSSHTPYKTPYNRYAFNGWNGGKLNSSNLWNTGVGFTTMYYNSYDNNCYSTYNRTKHNFSALMQKNGIQRNVFQRPEINYTEVWQTKATVTTAIADTNAKGVTTSVGNDVSNTNKSYTTTLDPNTNTSTSNKSSTNTKNNSNINNTTTTKRWDNHNADLNITPNTNKTENNTSRSGTYSEGSRNNNYIYKGSAITNKGSTNKGGTNKGKDPNK
jgi:hypothetical protein